MFLCEVREYSFIWQKKTVFGDSAWRLGEKRKKEKDKQRESMYLRIFASSWGSLVLPFFQVKNFFFYDHDFCVNPPASIVFGIISLLLCFPPLSLCMIVGGERLGYAFVT